MLLGSVKKTCICGLNLYVTLCLWISKPFKLVYRLDNNLGGVGYFKNQAT